MELYFLSLFLLYQCSQCSLFLWDIWVPSTIDRTQFHTTFSNYDIWGIRKTSENTTKLRILSNAEVFLPPYVINYTKTRFLKKASIQQTATTGYRTTNHMFARQHALHQQYAFCSTFVIGSSFLGADISALRITKAQEDTLADTPEFVFMGVHHAREWSSGEVVMQMAEWVVENADLPFVDTLLQNTELWFIPVLNPDGYDYSFEMGDDDISDKPKRLWRKNRRGNSSYTWGVDLNRNYPYLFGDHSASVQKNKSEYRGTSPWSEPEVGTVRDFMGFSPTLLNDTDKKDASKSRVPSKYLSNPLGVLFYHSFGQELLYPLGGSEDIPTNKQYMHQVGNGMSTVMEEHGGGLHKYTVAQAADVYLASGDACDWFWWDTDGKPCFTVELPPSYEESEKVSNPWDYPYTKVHEVALENTYGALYFAATVLHHCNRTARSSTLKNLTCSTAPIQWFDMQWIEEINAIVLADISQLQSLPRNHTLPDMGNEAIGCPQASLHLIAALTVCSSLLYRH